MPEPPPPHVGHLIRLAQQIHTRMWNATVSEEVTSPQFQLLFVLESAPNVDQRTATELARLDRSTGAELIERLARHGLIERQRDQGDRRRYLLSLTPDGAALVRGLFPAIGELHLKMLDLVPEELRSPFLEALRSFVSAAEADVTDV
ncbi:MAG TPA: MarR family winged helix-turn-helix transcriptional regulator [Acidimicrobiales bacterium]